MTRVPKDPSSAEPPGRRGLDPEAHVLVVEDDTPTRHLIARLLRENGFRATGVRDGREMWETLRNAEVDLVLLDVMLPGESGLELLRGLHAERGTLPVVMVTAKGTEADRVLGLDLGADDYLAKPFGRRELLARVRAVLRRARPATAASEEVAVHATVHRLRFDGWTVDLARRELLAPEGAVVDLSGAGYALLLAFLEHPRRVLARDQILELSRGRLADPNDRSVDVLVSRLRRKLEGKEGGTAMIKTVRGAGYMFLPAVERVA
ncbi:response regulator transcription factor [Siccirubricoccus sp. KC 17139]|uniref:Response regulator transcription factor n=1 Tax=Siccirubricoccus soli TaxID=2899147 RepID=A0ABT1D2Q2_9PROT|nr:response regulator transcription factor [Siccirubricoccus soli]MCO6416201.1 response regulator transcription factor [Siccirubricoccus soli]MCP2682335.1 response regulator transcription factor [Siccirubricoccus soli]